MTENKYKTKRIINGKPPLRTVIVDDNGKVVNKNPTKEELKGLETEILPAYTRGNKKRIKTCCSCESHDTYTNPEGYERWFACNCRREKCTEYLCKRCYNREDPFKDGRSKPRNKDYTDEELLDFLIQFYKENGRPPTKEDFNNFVYPSHSTYRRRFGNWGNALKLVGLNAESMVKKGVIENNDQKARLAEIKVINHFRQHPTDLSGGNKNSHCDGICPNGKTYDVKSSGLYGTRHTFSTKNKYKEEIELYYFLAFNEDYSKLMYVWRVPGEIVEDDWFLVGSSWAKFNIYNMKEYDITDKFRSIVEN